MSHKLTWCWGPDEHILQIWGAGCAKKIVKFIKFLVNEWKSGAVETLWNSAAQRQQYRKVKHHSNHPDKRSFSSYCQAVRFSHFFSTCWVGCVLIAHEPLKCSNGTEPRPPFLGDLGSVVLFHTRVQLLCSYMSKQTEPKGKCPATPSISPDVKAP